MEIPETHEAVPHPHSALNQKIGSKINAWFGSMRTFWILAAWQGTWMLLATLGLPLIENDPYPFSFLLFISNIIQLLALPVLGNTQNMADEKRDRKADADHTALTYLANNQDKQTEMLKSINKQLSVLNHPSNTKVTNE